MDAAADDDPTFAHGFESCRHQGADGREDDGGVERLGRTLIRASGPRHAKRAGEILRRAIAGPREGVHLAPLRFRDLRHDMGRGAEAVDAEARNLSSGRSDGEFQRAVADQPGAKKRRGFGVAIVFG